LIFCRLLPKPCNPAGHAAAHLVFAVMTTAYILIPIQPEERDLITAFGGEYIAHKTRTPMLVPRLWPARHPTFASSQSELRT
jgi:hypothetical protein